VAADDVVINIRTRGGRQAAREADAAAGGIRRIGRAASFTSRGISNFRRNTDLSAFSLYSLRRAGYTAGLAIGGLGALAIKSGLAFNASMEQNEIAFTQFLGSSQAARRELAYLYKTAAATPFEVPQITQASRQLLAFGFGVKQANSLLATLGDAAAGAGLGADAIDRMVLAFGQIRAKGKLQSEELLQLEELGVVDPNKVAKNLGITVAQLANAGNEGIKSSKAIRAIQKALDDSFGGQSAKQAKTFNGQLSTLHDNVNQTLGALTKPAFTSLEKTWLPALGSTTTRINQIFSDPKFAQLDFSQKIKLSKTAARHRLGPLVDAAEDTISDMHLGPKLEGAFEDGMTRLADTAAREAPHVAKAFIDAWWHAGPWGKFLSALWLGRKVSKGGLGLGGTFGARGVPVGAGSLANPIAVVDVAGGKGNIADLAKKFGVGAAALKFARGAGPAGAFLLGSGLAGGPFGSDAGLPADQERRQLAEIHRRGRAARGRENFGHAGGDPAGRFSGGARASLRRGGDVVWVLDAPVTLTSEAGQLVAKGVGRAVADTKARR
jgi:tape measure domain-containing protein